MRTARIFIPLALAATLIAARDDPVAKALEGRVAGRPQSCISPSWTNGPTVLDNRTIMYREAAGRRIWITNPRGRCTRLREPATLIVQVNGAGICRNDRFQVLGWGSNIPSPFCFFGDFTPYDRTERD